MLLAARGPPRVLRPVRAAASRVRAGGAGAGPARSWSLHEATARRPWHRKEVACVLVSPEIPQNTGSIARTCAATNVALHLVQPLGFEVDDARLKRAGLDYWPYVCVETHPSWDRFLEFFDAQPGPKRLVAFTKAGALTHSAEALFRDGDYLVFGKESVGLSERELSDCERRGATVRIPMSERHVRSLNLAVSVGVGLYEALRQLEAGPGGAAGGAAGGAGQEAGE